MSEWVPNTARINIYQKPDLYGTRAPDYDKVSQSENPVQNHSDIPPHPKMISESGDLPVKEKLYDAEEEVELDDYEIVRPEFFAHLREPAFTVNVDKICVNTACVRLLPDVDFVQILINRQERKLLLLPCDDTEITGYRWAKDKNGKRYASQRMGEPFVLTLCRIMDWNPDYRYKILGRMVHSKGKTLIAFDLNSFECFPKKITADGKNNQQQKIIVRFRRMGWKIRTEIL